MMTKEVVFHLGDHKTGSTSIQAVLRAETVVSSKKVGYPCPGLHHAYLAKAIQNSKDTKNLSRHFRRTKRLIEATDADIVVISAERFEGVLGHEMKAALEEHMPEYLPSARFISYVRPHADRVVSSWSEQTKLGNHPGTLDEYFDKTKDRRRFEFNDRFVSWRKAFGDAFELRPMVRDTLYKGDVVQDFFKFVLRDEGFEITGETAANESLTLEDLAMLNVINGKIDAMFQKYGMEQKHRKSISAISRNLGIHLAQFRRSGGTKPAIHKSLLAKVQKLYADDAAKIDAEFFAGTPMTDALNAIEGKAIEEAQSIEPSGLLTPEEIRMTEAIGDFMSQTALMAPGLWVKFFANTRTGSVHRKVNKGGSFLKDIAGFQRVGRKGRKGKGKKAAEE